MQKIAIFGGTGLAGSALRIEAVRRGLSPISIARRNADINFDATNLTDIVTLLDNLSPDGVINAAAKVNIEQCERDPTKTSIINSLMPMELSKWCASHDVAFVQISTDHYFKGAGPKAHSEAAEVQLLNQYASQKFAAEKFCLNQKNSLILRTNIVGIRGWEKLTFAEWAIEAIKTNSDATFFDDYWTSSIDTETFARALFDLFLVHRCDGLINIGSSEVFSKADFARELASRMGCDPNKLKVGSVLDKLGNRPNSLGLSVDLAHKALKWKLPSLAEVVANTLSQNPT